MWWAGSRLHDVYLGTRAVIVCRGPEVDLSRPVEGFDEALEVLSKFLCTIERPTLRIWLSGGLSRPFIVPVVAGVATATERSKVATAMAGARTGMDGECRVWIERAKVAKPAVAVAVQEACLSKIDKMLVEIARKSVVRSIRPWWSDVLRAVSNHRRDVDILGVRDCDSLTVLVAHDKEFAGASTYNPVLDDDMARSAMARALMTIESADQTALCCALLPGSSSIEQATFAEALALGSMTEFAP